MFFLQSGIKTILTRDMAESILDCQCETCAAERESNSIRFEYSVNWIIKKAHLLLAILIYLDDTHWINKFVAKDINDNELHKVINFLSEHEPGGLSLGFKESYQITLNLFKPSMFVTGSPEFHNDDYERLTYLNDEYWVEGSFAVVRRFEIHPDYLDGTLKSIVAKYALPSAGSPASDAPVCMLPRRLFACS